MNKSFLQTRPACVLCGSHRLRLDEVTQGGTRLGLGECERCQHRWTFETPPNLAVRVLAPARRQAA